MKKMLVLEVMFAIIFMAVVIAAPVFSVVIIVAWMAAVIFLSKLHEVCWGDGDE